MARNVDPAAELGGELVDGVQAAKAALVDEAEEVGFHECHILEASRLGEGDGKNPEFRQRPGLEILTVQGHGVVGPVVVAEGPAGPRADRVLPIPARILARGPLEINVEVPHRLGNVEPRFSRLASGQVTRKGYFTAPQETTNPVVSKL